MTTSADEFVHGLDDDIAPTRPQAARLVGAVRNRDAAIRAAVWREAAEYMDAQAGAMGRLGWSVAEQSYLKSAEHFRSMSEKESSR